MSKNLNLKLKIWRQAGPHAQGSFLEVDAHDIPEDASFLEMLDVVNERLSADDVEPVTFGHDCREGICGTCGVMINGQAHGPEKATATCQLHMRKFNDGDEIVIEPWQATSFPILKDLMVDRRAFDRIVEAGGYISAPTGTAPDANEIPIPKEVADTSMDAAACIGCGACVAACPNSAGQLFTSAKLPHLNTLPQGQPERRKVSAVRSRSRTNSTSVKPTAAQSERKNTSCQSSATTIWRTMSPPRLSHAPAISTSAQPRA